VAEGRFEDWLRVGYISPRHFLKAGLGRDTGGFVEDEKIVILINDMSLLQRPISVIRYLFVVIRRLYARVQAHHIAFGEVVSGPAWFSVALDIFLAERLLQG
jgi:hypothetical protein